MAPKGQKQTRGILLPNDILEHILEYAERSEWNAVAQTCSIYRKVATIDRLWVKDYHRLSGRVMGFPTVERDFRKVCLQTNFLKGRGRLERALSNISWLKRNRNTENNAIPNTGIKVLGSLARQYSKGNSSNPEVVALAKTMLSFPFPNVEFNLPVTPFDTYGEEEVGLDNLDNPDDIEDLKDLSSAIRRTVMQELDIHSQVFSRCRMPMVHELPPSAVIFLVNGAQPARAALSALEEELEKEVRWRSWETPTLILHLLPPLNTKKSVTCFSRPEKQAQPQLEEVECRHKRATRSELIDVADEVLQGAPFKFQSVRCGEGDMEIIRAAIGKLVEMAH